MIKPIILEKTEQTPEVILDQENNVFQISGRSLLIDPRQFYSPIISWFKEYFNEPNLATKLILNLDYFNSPTSLQLIKIINQFDQNNNKKNEMNIVWMYKREDERAKESGEEFKQICEINILLKETKTENFESFDFDFEF